MSVNDRINDIMSELMSYAEKPLWEQVRIICDEGNEEEGDNIVPCRKCHGKGYIYVQDNCEYHKERCVCADSRDALNRIKRMGYLDICKRCTFDTFDAYDETMAWVKGKCEEYAKHPEGWLFLGGQSGFGKTHLAWACFGMMVKRHRSPRVMLWIQDSQKIKQLVTDPFEYNYQIECLQDADILIIDDLFNVKPSDADIKLARTILDYRYVNNLPTIITCEYMLGDLNEWDDAITGRIAEMCRNSTLIQVAPSKVRNYRLRFVND